MPTSQQSPGLDWLEAELADTLDEDYELELEDVTLSEEIARIYKREHPDQIDRQVYFRELAAAAVGADPAAILGAAPQGKGRGHLRGARLGGQGRRDQAHHPAAEPARGAHRGPARPVGPRKDPVVFPALRPAPACRAARSCCSTAPGTTAPGWSGLWGLPTRIRSSSSSATCPSSSGCWSARASGSSSTGSRSPTRNSRCAF